MSILYRNILISLYFIHFLASKLQKIEKYLNCFIYMFERKAIIIRQFFPESYISSISELIKENS